MGILWLANGTKNVISKDFYLCVFKLLKLELHRKQIIIFTLNSNRFSIKILQIFNSLSDKHFPLPNILLCTVQGSKSLIQ